MRDFLLQSMPVLLWVLAGLNLVLLALLLVRRHKSGQLLPLLMALVAFGLCYDALVLALGTLLPPGNALAGLSKLRFVFHCALIPLLLPICGLALGWGRKLGKVGWAVTELLIAAGLAAGFATVLKAETVGAVARYTSDKALTPGWSTAVQSALSYGPVVLLILCGLAAWIRQKNPHLFLSGLFMFAFAALGPATGNFDLIFLITMFGEVLMTLFFWLYAKTRGQPA